MFSHADVSLQCCVVLDAALLRLRSTFRSVGRRLIFSSVLRTPSSSLSSLSKRRRQRETICSSHPTSDLAFPSDISLPPLMSCAQVSSSPSSCSLSSSLSHSDSTLPHRPSSSLILILIIIGSHFLIPPSVRLASVTVSLTAVRHLCSSGSSLSFRLKSSGCSIFCVTRVATQLS